MIVNWILALTSGAFLVLLFPQWNFVWLAPIALTPLIVASAREDRWLWRAALGYAAGIVYWFGTCGWIENTLSKYAGVSATTAWFLFGLFCLTKAIQMGVFAALAGPLMRTIFAAPAIAALWVVIEWTHVYTGFEWLNLGNAGADMAVLLRLAPFTGVWGLSFVFALMSAAVACLALRLPRSRFAWLLLLPFLYLLPDAPADQPGDTAAILAQPNISDDAQWTPDFVTATEDRLRAMSLSPLLGRRGDAALIVWPEMPAPLYENDPAFLHLLSSVAASAHASIVTGAVARAPDGAPLNSALLVAPDGREISRYDKVHLVPFGEFVPWPFGLLTRKVSTEAGDFEAGKSAIVSSLDGHHEGTFICYESVFPGYIRQFAKSGAEVLLNISNDSWFGRSAARYQHLLMVRMRAAENHRWILRSTNNGITAVIDPAGRVARAAAQYEELAARFRYRYRDDLTFYTRYGDWFVGLCAAIAVGGLVSARRASFAQKKA